MSVTRNLLFVLVLGLSSSLYCMQAPTDRFQLRKLDNNSARAVVVSGFWAEPKTALHRTEQAHSTDDFNKRVLTPLRVTIMTPRQAFHWTIATEKGEFQLYKDGIKRGEPVAPAREFDIKVMTEDNVELEPVTKKGETAVPSVPKAPAPVMAAAPSAPRAAEPVVPAAAAPAAAARPAGEAEAVALAQKIGEEVVVPVSATASSEIVEPEHHIEGTYDLAEQVAKANPGTKVSEIVDHVKAAIVETNPSARASHMVEALGAFARVKDEIKDPAQREKLREALVAVAQHAKEQASKTVTFAEGTKPA